LNPPIYHLAHPDDADKLKQTGSCRAPSLDTEGFIHCCSSTQLPGVIQRYYLGVEKLVLLQIDPDQLTQEVVYENTSGGTELFPHVYAEINASAVLSTTIVDQPSLARIAASEQYQP